MAKFDAGLEDLEYDFTKFVPGAKGVIPEPSGDQVEVFMGVLRETMPTKPGVDKDGNETRVLDIEAISERFEDADSDVVEAILNDACSRLCSGTPSAAEIAALPYRPKRSFYGWLIGTFLSPEA